MKNYKFLIPLVLVALFLISIYSLNSTKVEAENRYNEYINAARSFRGNGILVDANKNYFLAIDERPSVELYSEIGEMYIEFDQIRTAEEWGETFINAYPKDVKSYEYAMKVNYNMNEYIECFKIAEKLSKRKLSSSYISEIMAELEYKYYFNNEYDEVGVYSSGLCPVYNGKAWGYINEKGRKSIGNNFVKVGPFTNDIAPVVDTDGNAYYIDSDGNKKHVLNNVNNIVELGMAANSIIPAYNGSTWDFYDYEGNYLFGGYSNVSCFGNGYAAVQKNGKWMIIDKEGQIKIEKEYSDVIIDEKTIAYRNERLFVHNGQSYEMIDIDGKTYGNQKYEDARLFNDESYAAVKINGKWGFIDNNGNIAIEPKFSDAKSFSNGFAAVEIDGKWGFIDTTGKIVIDVQFDDAKYFNTHGCVLVNNGEKWQMLMLYKYNY